MSRCLAIGTLCTVSGTAAATPNFDAALFARTELASGSAPSAPGLDPEATFSAEFTPGAALRLRTPRSTFRLAISPRLVYRQPNLGDLERPLVSIGSDAQLTHRLSRRWQWSANAAVSAGESEYLSPDVLLASPVASRLEEPVLSVVTLSAETWLEWFATRTYEMRWGISADSTEARNVPSDTFPTTKSYTVGFEQRWILSPRSSLIVPLSVRRFEVDPEGDLTTISGGIGYRYQIDRRTEVQLLPSVSYVLPEDDSAEIFATGSVTLRQILSERRGRQVINRLRLALDSTYDPTLGEVRPIMSLDATITAQLGPRWDFNGQAYFGTSTSSEPLESNLPETSISSSASFVRRVSNSVSLEFGARYSIRASHLRADPFQTQDRLILGFVALSAAFGVDRTDSGDWAF